VEMFLHHVVTLMLYGFSYLVNMTAAGSVVMYLHDWADIFTSIVRCFTETTLLPFTLFGITGMAISWFYTRLIIFPVVIYKACFKYDIYNGAGFIGA
jgi:TLC domain